MTENTIYLDNAATTKPCPTAVRAVLECMENFGNPSSLHGIGIAAEKRIKTARQDIARKLGVSPSEIYFTSGGTESDNIAIFGAARKMKKRGRHIVTTSIEHPAVLECMKALEDEGFEVSYLEPDKTGAISLKELDSVLREDTVLVSIMHVNNETGVMQPVDKVRGLLEQKAPHALFHSDAVQSFGKTELRPKEWGIDLLSISGHKIHAPQGIGVLYCRVNKLHPIIFGGGQQEGLRPGTENLPGIYALGETVREIDVVKNSKHLHALRGLLKDEITKKIENVKINGADDNNAGSVLNVSFPGIRSEILLHVLEARGIYVSTGSACSSHKPQKSHVLTAMGCSAAETDSAVRFSFSHMNTTEEIIRTAEVLAEEVPRLRRIMR